MNLLLVADAFPPMRTSAAVHMHDLAIALHDEGHSVTVLVPSHLQTQGWVLLPSQKYEILCLASFKSKDVSFIRRGLAELLSPYLMYYHFRSSPVYSRHIDKIVWYSPTIFFGPLIRRLKKHFSCPAYLILRDLFPDWAVDLGLMKKRFIYFFLKKVEFFQYSLADVIGVQSPGNLKYFNGYPSSIKDKVEVLWTWASMPEKSPASIDLSQTILSGRVIFIYAGNMGIAQNVDLFLDLARSFNSRNDVGFIFVGRGSEFLRLRKLVSQLGLVNTLFFDEIDSTGIPGLYEQCDIGLISLDIRHKTHNIPGKFISYMQSSLPVLARINQGNDLGAIIRGYEVGAVSEEDSLDNLILSAERLLGAIRAKADYSESCHKVMTDLFSTKNAIKQIV